MERKSKREEAQTLIDKAGDILENAARVEQHELTEDENYEFDTLHKDAEKLLDEVPNSPQPAKKCLRRFPPYRVEKR